MRKSIGTLQYIKLVTIIHIYKHVLKSNLSDKYITCFFIFYVYENNVIKIELWEYMTLTNTHLYLNFESDTMCYGTKLSSQIWALYIYRHRTYQLSRSWSGLSMQACTQSIVVMGKLSAYTKWTHVVTFNCQFNSHVIKYIVEFNSYTKWKTCVTIYDVWLFQILTQEEVFLHDLCNIY